MRDHETVRAGEQSVEWKHPPDASLIFIGRIHTPWRTRKECPRRGHEDGPLCRIEIFHPWRPALQGIGVYERLEVLYWLHQTRRDLVLQSPRDDGTTRGTFALRSPVRPNPIGTAIVVLIDVSESAVFVRGLDCLDGTPLLDIKPDFALRRPPTSQPAGRVAL